jgi:hypothetical protein
MTRFSFKLTKRAHEATHPLNNLALTLAFACVGLLNTALNLISDSRGGLLQLIF